MRKDKARTAQVRVNGYEHHNPLRWDCHILCSYSNCLPGTSIPMYVLPSDLDWGATEMRKDKARTAQVRVNGYEHHNPLRGRWLIRIPNSQTSILRCSRYGSSPPSSTNKFFGSCSMGGEECRADEHVKGADGHDEAVNCHTGH
ncbi:hypothetical protein TRIUR3_14052 [Triticum urartu]|uniref:Uncharacterized protein n=1 Tax=Triticum urartu TaxID=4572 RepID=M8AQY5_TRIUA|nr:hypothetical protein TRIUR3_14052 [Triticum urartu]